ncbi:MAG: YIP1 family protein [Euryarchaeota archaeon]|nr:YIP1 family protein [Euryarchaeota archaeon]
MRFANRMKKVIVSPRETFQNILAEGFSMTEPVGIVLGMNFLKTFLAGLCIIRGIDEITEFFSERVHISPDVINWEIDLSGFTGVILVAFVGIALAFATYSLIPWILTAGIGHATAKYMFKGIGDFESLLCTYGYSQIASLATVFGLLIFILHPVAGFFALIAMKIAESLWTLALRILSVSETYGLDLGRSFICVIMPYLLPILLVILLSGVPFIFHT